MSARLFERVCLGDEETATRSLLAARRVLEARARLWDAALAALPTSGLRLPASGAY
jgi:hypothetical protein